MADNDLRAEVLRQMADATRQASEALTRLLVAWEQTDSETREHFVDPMAFATAGYPFHESLDEIIADVDRFADLLSDAADYPEGAHIVEAVCDRCGQTFQPADPFDLVHAFTYPTDGSAEVECGGLGRLAGFYS